MAESPGFESLIDRYQLKKGDVDKQITDKHIEVISRSSCGKWRSLPAHLELESIVIDDIDHQPVDEDEKRNKFFTTWKTKKGAEATYKKLISALQTIECNEAAECVCKLLSQSQPQQQQNLREPEQQEEQEQQPEQHAAHPDMAGKNPSASGDESYAGSTLDPSVYQDLRHQLKMRRNQIITRYAKFSSSVYEIVKIKNVPVGDFLYFLKSLPDCKNKFNSLPEDSTLLDVFYIIGDKLASYLHYEIFLSIIEKYCTSSEISDCDDFRYPEYLKDYINHLDIKHFLEINSELENLSSTDMKKLCLKIDMDETTKITRIKDLESSIAEILGPSTRPSELKLIDVKKGCLILTFLIPNAIFTKTLTKDQIKKFHSLSIRWLKCDDIEVDCREEKFEDSGFKEHVKELTSKAIQVLPQRPHYLHTFEIKEEERRDNLGQVFEGFARVIQSLKNWHTTSAIEEIKILADDVSVLKNQHKECTQKLERAKTSAGSFVNSAENFLNRATLDQEQEATIKEYYKKGNYEEIKKYITQVQQYFTETQKYYTEFREKFDAASSSCTDIIKACHDKKTNANGKMIGTRMLGSGATLAGVSTMGIALSAVAGVFTLGAGTVIGLAVTGAVTGTAGVSAYYYADNFKKLEEAFKNLGSKFENMSFCITNLEMDIYMIIEELNKADQLLRNLSVHHLTTEQGSEIEYKQFTKCFEYLLHSVRTAKVLISNQSMAM